MIAEIQLMICLLSSDKYNIYQVSQKLGTITYDHGMTVEIKPLDREFKKIAVSREIDLVTNNPKNIPLVLSIYPADPPPVDIFKQAFGKYEELTPSYHPRQEIAFYLQTPDKPFRVIMFVESKDNRVLDITLRRDLKL